MHSWQGKYAQVVETRDMLDENVRVLTRRISDMELELTDKTEKLKKMERANAEAGAKLDSIYDEQMSARQHLEQQMRQRLEEREREIMGLKEQVKSVEHRKACELDVVK